MGSSAIVALIAFDTGQHLSEQTKTLGANAHLLEIESEFFVGG